MDVVCFDILRRAIAALHLAADTGRGLDAMLAGLLGVLADLPGLSQAAVVLIDAEERPTIRASLGAPDVGLILSAALERGPQASVAKVLRRGAEPAPADVDGGVALSREEAAMLAAPLAIGGDGGLGGWLFVDGLLGRQASLSEELRLAVLVAGLIGRMADVAAAGARQTLDMARELAFLRSKVSLRYRHVFSEGTSPALGVLQAGTDQAALSDAPLVLLGEAGSGRGVLARLIHELSPRAVRPFAVFEAGGQGRDVMLRLFGGVRSLGAGAGPGLLETAEGGTLLIEEPHQLPPEAVEGLAGYLASGAFARLGGGRTRPGSTRLVFKAPASGLGLDLGTARPLVLRVPGLRERREDIPALLDHMLSLEAARGGRRLTLTSKALKALESYDWPGNIREMEVMAARLAVSAPEDRVDIADIPPEILAEGERPPILPEDAAELRDMERQQVLNALERHGWVQSRAARELGLTLRQIGYRIRKYGLARDENGESDN